MGLKMKNTISRNLGIDLLRIVLMLMIVFLHFLGTGGISGNATMFSSNYEVSYFIEIACNCAINCFALITGYVCINSKNKLSRFISLWFQVIFYTITITGIFQIFAPNLITKNEVVYAIFPIFSNQYWYFTAYFVLFIFMPYINKLLKSLSKTEFKKLVITLIGMFSVIQFIPLILSLNLDIFNIRLGNSTIWLFVLYCIGAYIKTFDVKLKNKNILNFLLYIFMVFVAWTGKYIIEVVSVNMGGKIIIADQLLVFNSPFMLLISIFLFMFFINLDIRNKLAQKVIGLLAPVSFGVYLIHTHPLVFNNIIRDRFTFLINESTLVLLMYITIAALVTFISCLLIDYIRLKLFKVLKVDSLSEKIENILNKSYQKIFEEEGAKKEITN